MLFWKVTEDPEFIGEKFHDSIISKTFVGNWKQKMDTSI
jgi:hypothetical protein